MIAPSLSLDALKAVCSTSDARPSYQGPFAVTINDTPWTIATDGWRLVAVRHDYGAEHAVEGIDRSVRGFYVDATADGARALDTAPLREFFAAHAPPPLGTCPECNGKASEECDECDGDGEVDCECIDCGDSHSKQCKACHGVGSFTCDRCKNRDAKVPVQIGEAVYDARIMAPLLAILPSGEVRFRQRGAHGVTTLAGDDWFALMMPLRNDTRGPVPTLDLPADAVAA